MNNDIQSAAGVFTIHATSNSVSVNTHATIPRQTIRLKNVRVEMTSASVALSEKVLYVDLPFLSASQLIDHRENLYQLPILLDNAIVTNYQTDLPLHLLSDVQERFRIIVRNESGALVSNLVSITLQFSYELNRT